MTVKHENNYFIINYNLQWDMKNNNIGYYLVFILAVFIILIIGMNQDRKKKKKKKKSHKQDLLMINDGEELKEAVN